MNLPRGVRYQPKNSSVCEEQQRTMVLEVRGRAWIEFEQHSWNLLMIVQYRYYLDCVSFIESIEVAKSELYF